MILEKVFGYDCSFQIENTINQKGSFFIQGHSLQSFLQFLGNEQSSPNLVFVVVVVAAISTIT